MKKLLLIISMLLIPATCWPVDGYKNLKFGIKKEFVKKSKLCNFKEIKQDGGSVVDVMACRDFKFNGINTQAYAYFIDGKFLRFVFEVPNNQFTSLVEALGEKYGKASSGSSREEFQAVDKYPDREAYLSFDKDTIIIMIKSDTTGMQSIGIIYNSPDYDRLLAKKQKAGMRDSL